MRAQGYACLTDPDLGVKECDTHTCAHCQRLVHVPPNKQIETVGDICRGCMAVICLYCAGKGCTPFMKKIEAMEARAYARRQYV